MNELQEVFFNEMEKIAVNLKQLRTAFKKTVSPHLMRPTKSSMKNPKKDMTGMMMTPRYPDSGKPAGTAATIPGNKDMTMIMDRSLKRSPLHMSDIDRSEILEEQAKQLKDLAARFGREPQKDTKIVMKLSKFHPFLNIEQATQSRPSSPLKGKPKGSEAFNRAIGLHEAAEMRSMREVGAGKPRERFMSHLSLRPALQDLIIAATYTGPDAPAFRKQMLLMRRPEISQLVRYFKDNGNTGMASQLEALVDQARRGRRAGEPRVMNKNDIEAMERAYAKAVENERIVQRKQMDEERLKEQARRTETIPVDELPEDVANSLKKSLQQELKEISDKNKTLFEEDLAKKYREGLAKTQLK